MAITITNSGPDDVNEYGSLSGTFTLLDSLAGTEFGLPGSNVFVEHPKIVKVTASEPFAPGLTLSITGDNTIEYSGRYDDVFERHWKYVTDPGNTKHDVPKVADLPASYIGLYAFIPPSVNSKTITYSFYAWTHDNDLISTNNPAAYTGYSMYAAVPANLSTITPEQMTLVGTYTITVHYDWSADRAAFQDALTRGTLYQQALSKGLVG